MRSDVDAIRSLLVEYFHGFDAKRSEESWLGSLFTEDATVKFPVGSGQGLVAVSRLTRRATELWGPTLHLLGSELVTLDGGRAAITATLHATHLHRDDDPGAPLQIGARIDAAATRTGGAWALHALALDLVWTTGDGPRRR